jgi:hypothetical protein
VRGVPPSHSPHMLSASALRDSLVRLFVAFSEGFKIVLNLLALLFFIYCVRLLF